MLDMNVRIAIIGLVALTPMVVGGAEDQSPTQTKTLVVIDANGAPVPDARIYRDGGLIWDNQRQAVRVPDEEPWGRTDANGMMSFEFIRRSSRGFLVTDGSFDQMACFYIARTDPAENYTIQLNKPARIKGAITSEKLGLSDVHVELSYHYRVYADVGSFLDTFLSSDYRFETPRHEIALDMLCPAGCDLNLRVEPRDAGIHTPGRGVDIPALPPGQVYDFGSIGLRPTSGYQALGKPAPELQVGEWVRGQPVTLAELKGKVVLLDFWGLWCGPCRRAMPSLVDLHKQYARDGLVIIAMHDASQSKASLLDEGQPYLDVSALPFRVAVDAMPLGSETAPLQGQGRTIDAYGVTEFPTSLLIDRKGQVQSTLSEEQLYLLLHGRPMHKPTTFMGRLIATNRPLFIQIGVGVGLILFLVLVLVLVGVGARRSRGTVGDT